MPLTPGLVSRCHRKAVYPSKSKARESLARLRKRKHDRLLGETRSPLTLSVYHCFSCGMWHVGNKY